MIGPKRPNKPWPVRAVIDGNDRLDSSSPREAAYEFIRRTLVRFDYPTLNPSGTKMTGLAGA